MQTQMAEGPPDRYHLVYIIFVLLGACTLFPWNAFITAPEYFMEFYKFVTDEVPTGFLKDLYANILNWFSVLNFVFTLGGMGLIIQFVDAVNGSVRIFVSLVVLFMVLAAPPLLAMTTISAGAAAGVILFLISACGFFTSGVQGSVYGLAATLPPHITQAAMLGQGLSGIIVCGIRLVLISVLPIDDSLPDDERLRNLKDSTAVYFIVSCAWMILCGFAYMVLLRLDYYRHWVSHVPGETESLIKSQKQEVITYAAEDPEAPKASALEVFKIIYPLGLSVMGIFTVTLAIFPGQAVRVGDQLPDGQTPDLSSPTFTLIILAVFFACDFLGRALSRRWLICKAQTLPLVTILRGVLLPLFCFCVKPLVFKSQWVSLSLMFVMATSNGYFASLTMMYAPQTPRLLPHMKELTGTVMATCTLTGCSLGSGLGLIIVNFIQQLS